MLKKLDFEDCDRTQDSLILSLNHQESCEIGPRKSNKKHQKESFLTACIYEPIEIVYLRINSFIGTTESMFYIVC